MRLPTIAPREDGTLTNASFGRAPSRTASQVATLEESPATATAQADEKRASSAARAQCLDHLGQIICRLRTPPPAPPTAAAEAAPFAVRPDTPLEDLSALLDAADCIASFLLRTRGGGARELVRSQPRRALMRGPGAWLTPRTRWSRRNGRP